MSPPRDGICIRTKISAVAHTQFARLLASGDLEQVPWLIYLNADPAPGCMVRGMKDERYIPLRCPNCAEPMRLTRIIPAIGVLPELYSYYCDRCGEAETEAGEPHERRDVLASAFLGDRAVI